MSFLAPLFFLGLAAIAVPVFVHLIQRERKDVIYFPSLMFLRKIPYQSVERRRIHNWLLLLLRAAAMALVIAAFTRPFFKVDPVLANLAREGAREVVILLDNSASMGYGDHWKRAQDEARKVVGSLAGEDKATLILFARNEEEAVRATSDKGQLEVGIANAAVTSDSTRFAPALRVAQSILSRSALPRKEAVLISDFQKSGWERQEEIRLPEGASLAPISVADAAAVDLSISSVNLPRQSFANEERVMVTAGLTNRGPNAVTNLPVKFEVNGRTIDTRQVTIGPNASGSVTFPAFTIAEPNMQAVIRAGEDNLKANNAFYFVLSPSRPVSVLILQGDNANTDSCGSECASFFLMAALNESKAPPFKIDLMPVSRATPAALERRSLVVLNDTSALPTELDKGLQRFVEQGGGLFIILKERSPWSGESPLMPGKLGAPIDRPVGNDATLGFLDYSHQIFEAFKDPRQASFAGIRFLRYRALQPAPTDHVLARFDDGAVAMVERKVGAGRSVAFTAPLDRSWSDFPLRGAYLPFAILTGQYLAQYAEPEAFRTVGSLLDASAPMASAVREGAAGDSGATTRRASGVAVSPSGKQQPIGEGGAKSIELTEQGFYSVRMQGASAKPFSAAVDLAPSESDLSAMSPAEFVASATGRAAVASKGGSLENPEDTPADIEKKQAIWWVLFAAGAAALLAEGILANRLSKRFGAGLLQTAQTK